MRIVAWILTVTLLAGCGWQLRGVTPLPSEYRVLHLQSQAGNSFDQQLRLQLEFNDVLLADEAADAQAVLTVSALEIERRTLSINSSGQIGEYELNGRLEARLQRNDRDGFVLIELRGRRYLSNDVSNVVGTANSEQQQRADLERDMVRQLLRRLQRLNYDSEMQTDDTSATPGATPIDSPDANGAGA